MRDFERFARELQQEVERAVSTGDFGRLSASVTDTVERAAGSVFDRLTGKGPTGYKEAGYGGYGQADAGNFRQGGSPGPVRVRMAPILYRKQTGYRVFSILLGIAGGGGLFGSLSMLVGGAVLYFLKTPRMSFAAFLAGMIFFAITGAFSVGLLTAGIRMSGRLGRFARYIAVLGDREYGDVRQLAQAVRRSEKATVKELKWMIDRRWFLQGHMDGQDRCFILTDHMYATYSELEKERRKAQEADRSQRDKEAAPDPQEEQARHILEQGRAFIREIRSCNDRIPGEEISRKIDRMERVVRSIFDRLEREPAQSGDVQKMMDYYLPMSIKLLHAYEEMDATPVKGENIRRSMAEIEKTMDTITHAFERLLDELFRQTSWDVSSDIAVLQTLFEQEGLAGEAGKETEHDETNG